MKRQCLKIISAIVAAASLSACVAQKADTETLSELSITTAYETYHPTDTMPTEISEIYGTTDTTPAEIPETYHPTDTMPMKTSEAAAEIPQVSKTAAEQSEITGVGMPTDFQPINGQLSEALLKSCLQNEEKNFVISPLSIKLALSMAAAGAGTSSDTEAQMLNALGYSSKEEMTEDCKRLISELDREDGTITVSDSVWLSENFDNIYPEYLTGISENFKAENFTEDLTSDKFVNDINSWVKSKTNGLIPTIFSEPLDDLARMVLVNALYFNNEWEIPFSGVSNENIFHGVDGDVSTMFMHDTHTVDYAEGEIFKSIILPYKDDSVMKLYLPTDESKNVGNIISSMTNEQLAEAMELSYNSTEVTISIPRFECEFNNSMVETLKSYAILEAFDPNNANFGEMADISDGNLYISEVIHSAKIKCGEKGTEAAAVTAVIMPYNTAIPIIESIYFTADRPFMYEIESPSGETLFEGVVQSFN